MLPARGEGYVTAPCTHGELGPLRNCGFHQQDDEVACLAGADVHLRCEIPDRAAPQVVRFCDRSDELATAIPCTYEEALATVTVDAENTEARFTCPPARSATEPGGAYSLYAAPVFGDDVTQTVTCVAR
jgi:hypothetical protein